MTSLSLIDALESICFIYIGSSVIYLFFFAVLSRFHRSDSYAQVSVYHNILILFPAYKEDSVIIPSLHSFSNQEYPSKKYKVAVISDQMNPKTNEFISRMNVCLLKANFVNSSKAKALQFAIDYLKNDSFDIVVILDADNSVEPDFLEKINRAYHAGAIAIQAHRKGKDILTDIAILDAASEEMNNSFFRKGHVFIGLSAALSGSGMAFDYKWFRENISKVSSSGEDKELEVLLLKQRVYIEYLDDVPVYDQKIQNASAFYKQRRRWLAAQFGTLKMALKDLPEALITGNIDYANKLIQWMMLPRLLLLGLIAIFSTTIPFIQFEWALKWWGLLVILLITLGLAIPKELDNTRLEKALRKIPLLFVLMFINLFRLKGANKEFIHTAHGKTEDKCHHSRL